MPELLQCVSAIAVCLGVIWLERDGSVVTRDRFVEASEIFEGVSTIAVCFCIARLKGDRPVVTLNGILNLSEFSQRNATITVCFGAVRPLFLFVGPRLLRWVAPKFWCIRQGNSSLRWRHKGKIYCQRARQIPLPHPRIRGFEIARVKRAVSRKRSARRRRARSFCGRGSRGHTLPRQPRLISPQAPRTAPHSGAESVARKASSSSSGTASGATRANVRPARLATRWSIACRVKTVQSIPSARSPRIDLSSAPLVETRAHAK